MNPSVFIRTPHIKSLVIVAGSPPWSSWDGPSCCVPMIRSAVQPRQWRRKLPPHIRPLRVASKWSKELKSEQVYVESYALSSGVVYLNRVKYQTRVSVSMTRAGDSILWCQQQRWWAQLHSGAHTFQMYCSLNRPSFYKKIQPHCTSCSCELMDFH